MTFIFSMIPEIIILASLSIVIVAAPLRPSPTCPGHRLRALLAEAVIA